MTAAGTRAAATARRREAILAAALACFDEKGVVATTIADVRARSGASTGSIYHHFESKEELAAAVYVEGLGGYQHEVLAVLDEHADDAEGGIRGLVRHHLGWVARDPAMARYLLSSRPPEVARATRGPLRDLNRRLARGVDAWVARHVAAGRLRPLDSTLLYVVVLGPGQELARLWLAGRVQTPIEDAAEALADAAWAAVRAEGGKPG